MPITTFQFSKGPFLSVDSSELGDPNLSSLSKNCLVTAAGSLIDRPGLSSFAQFSSFPVIGVSYLGSVAVAVTSNRRIFSVTSAGVAAEITGTALEGTARPTFAQDGTYLVIAGGGEPRKWNGTGNTALYGGSIPDTSQIVYLDGYFIVIDPTTDDVLWAGPTAALRATFSAANAFQAETLPDSPTALAVCQRELYIAGQQSIEIFQNFGDSSVPFRRSFSVTGVGIGAANSFVEADNSLFFLDAERNFRQFQGRNPVNISTPQIGKVIKSFSTVSDCFGYKVDIDDTFTIKWTFPTAERTFEYDYYNKTWREVDGLESGITARFRANAHCYIPSTETHLVGDYNSGKLWKMTRASRTDGDNVRRIQYRTGHVDHGTGLRKRNKWLKFHVKRGIGTPGGVEPQFLVRFRDDNSPWSDPVPMGLGYTGENDHTITLFNTGIYRKRQIEIEMTDPHELVLTKVEENVEVLAS